VRYLTPLGVALIMVETVDLIFAVDSVPAVFAVTQDTFIVYTSNIFAILGLRALYFALAAAMNRFRYLQVSLAIVLVLIGIKVALVPFGVKIDTLLSLLVTIGILAGGIVFSLWKTRGERDISAMENPRQGQLEP
jgi:tellurite resistance protein TerC